MTYNFDEDAATTALNKLGLTMTSEFVPFSKSRNKDQKNKTLNWKVSVLKNGKVIWVGDYSQGMGHCPSYKTLITLDVKEAIDYECETGHKSLSLGMRGKKIDGPTLLEVMYSLGLDAQAGSESYVDFCSMSGYDEDSRKAEETWRACADVYRSFGAVLMEKINKITEGY